MAAETTTKAVRFADENDACSSMWVYEAYSTDILWFTLKDQEQTRRAARIEAREIRKRGVDTLLLDAFTNTDTGKAVQRNLNEYAKSKSNPRGLERFLSREHCAVRKQHKAHAVRAIVMAQNDAREHGHEQVEMEEQLRLLSITFSVHAKIFARRMGKADEACCYSNKWKKTTNLLTKDKSTSFRPPPQGANATAASLSMIRLSQRHLNAALT